MRICAISLPELRIELVRAREIGTVNVPLAVVVAPPPMTETKLLGNTRISVVSREARALGVLPGQTIAQARARASNLLVRVVRPDAVRDVLARLAEVGLAFGATVSFGVEGEPVFMRGSQQKILTSSPKKKGDFGDVVWIDITGCSHLHADAGARSNLFDNETILASRLAGVIASLGHTCAVAIADGPRVAAMLARVAGEGASRAAAKLRGGRDHAHALLLLEPVVVRAGENAQAIASLSVASLPLAAEDVRWLAKVGIRTIDELRRLPPEGLGARLGGSARDVMALATGDDRAPLRSYVPPEVPEEETELEYGIEGTQALTFVAKTLTDRIASRLQGRAVAASRIELDLHLDEAMLPAANDHEGPPSSPPAAASRKVVSVALDLPAPLSQASDLLAALRPKIERLVLPAPVLRARLRAPGLVHKRAAALSLFEPEPKAERALPRLVAELVSDLGSEAVSSLVLGDSWVPEERSKLVAFKAKGVTPVSGQLELASPSPPTKKQRRHLLSSVPEPTRLLASPRPISREGVKVTRLLSRVDSIEWWKVTPSSDISHNTDTLSSPIPQRKNGGLDYVQAWTDEGAAWIEIERNTGAMRIRGWFD